MSGGILALPHMPSYYAQRQVKTVTLVTVMNTVLRIDGLKNM